MSKLPITNTAIDRLDFLDGLAESIKGSESHGQSELLHSEQLPVEVRGDKQSLIDAGVVFGKPSDGDPLFCQASLPGGWAKRPMKGSLWSELMDDAGVVRATIFYKAAFYDRDAFMNVEDLEKP